MWSARVSHRPSRGCHVSNPMSAGPSAFVRVMFVFSPINKITSYILQVQKPHRRILFCKIKVQFQVRSQHMLLEESKLYHILSMSMTHVGLHIYISNHFRRLHRIKP